MHMSVLYVSDLCVFLTCTHNLNELKIKSLDKPFSPVHSGQLLLIISSKTKEKIVSLSPINVILRP